MSYTPTTWANGDTITAAGLNKIEQGIAGGVMLIHVDPETSICDKTWQQVHDALAAGKPTYFMNEWRLEETGEVYTNLAPVTMAGYMPNLVEEPQYSVGYLSVVIDYVEAGRLVANTSSGYLEWL